MRFLFFSFAIAIICLPASSQPVKQMPASTNVRSAQYPQILDDHRVVFRVKAPEAQRVQIDLGKKYEMVKDTGGYWLVTTDSISEGFHYYSLLVDGVPVADPSSETFYGMGRMASGIEIPFCGRELLCYEKCAARRCTD